MSTAQLPAVPRPNPPRIIISGAPASGKGTQCEYIRKEYGVVHLSTGDMLRAAVQADTPLGQEAVKFMNSGKLVPDALIIAIVMERLKEPDCVAHGWLLDGFPRSRGQADALLEAGIECDIFLQLDVDEQLLVERVAGRRMDPVTGKIYHLKYSPPPNDPDIIARLEQRADDTEEKCMHRINTYNQNLQAITECYAGKIHRFNGNRTPHQLWNEIRTKIPRTYKYEVVFVLGGPACGKGTLCASLAEATGYIHLSAGDLLRQELTTGSQFAELIQQHQLQGSIVPAEITVNLLARAMHKAYLDPAKSSRKFLIDGFPRNVENMGAWYSIMAPFSIVDFVLYLECSEEVMRERLLGRAKTSGRSDDNEETLNKRFRTFINDTRPVLETFDRLGKLRIIDATVPPSMVLTQAKRVVDSIKLIPPYTRTFALIKPDAVASGKITQIQEAIVEANLSIISSKLIQMNDDVVNSFYAEHREKPFFPELRDFMSSGPAVAMVIEGVDAVPAWRLLMGPTNTLVAQSEAPKSLRARYGTNGTRNACHGSDSEFSAMREIDFFMKPGAIGTKACMASEKEELNPSSGLSLGGLPMEETFAMIKPIASKMNYDEIMSIIAGQGFEVVSELKARLSPSAAARFYAEHHGKSFYDSLMEYMTSDRIVALHLRRIAAVTAWRYLIGPTNKGKADLERPKNCIRSLFGIDGTRNAVHGSDALSSANREINFFFSFNSSAPSATGVAVSSAISNLVVNATPSSAPPAVSSPPRQAGPNSPNKNRKPHQLPSLDRTEASVMKAYSIQEVNPVMQPLFEKLLINRPKNVIDFSIAELRKMSNSNNDVSVEPAQEARDGNGWDEMSVASTDAICEPSA